MKKILSLAALALLLGVAACQKGAGYKITGTVNGAQDGDTVILANVSGRFQIDTMQMTLVKDGKFVFEGVQDTAAIRYVIWQSAGEDMASVGTPLALENADITVRLDTAENVVSEVSGTPANDALTALSHKEMAINVQAQGLVEIIGGATSSEDDKRAAEQQLEGLQGQMMELYKQFIADNIANVAGRTYLVSYASMLDDDFVAQQLQALPEDCKDPDIATLRKTYSIKATTAVGKPLTDIKALTPDGTELAVSQVAANAKVLLIDFWASWCGPCRAEMPNVKAAYDKYHAQGFDIIGVSLDSDKEAWQKAIADLGITWPQISDLKGWECEGAAAYGVRAIPATVLIKDGIIVARDLRGADLAAKLQELLAE